MIRVEDAADGVRIFTLDRPPANAITAELVSRLGEICAEARDDRSVRAVIMRGGERFFSGGLDLKAMAAGGASDVADFGWGDGVADWWTFPKPTVAEIAGHAIAGGAILALASDVRIASTAPKKIGLNETAIGLSLPRGAFEIARNGLAPRHFARVILEGELVGPEEALERGFLHELVAPEELSSRAMAVASKLAQLPPISYADNKRLQREPCVQRCENEPEEERARRRGGWSASQDAFSARAAQTGKKD